MNAQFELMANAMRVLDDPNRVNPPDEPSKLSGFGTSGPRWEFFKQTDEKKLEAIKCFINEDKGNIDFYRDALYSDQNVMAIHKAMLTNDYCQLGAVVRGIFMAELGCAIQEQANKE
jgi:hypothetical protein